MKEFGQLVGVALIILALLSPVLVLIIFTY